MWGNIITYFPVLDWFIIMEGVQLHSLVGSCAVLILGAVFTNPEMEVVLKIFLIRIPLEC